MTNNLFLQLPYIRKQKRVMQNGGDYL